MASLQQVFRNLRNVPTLARLCSTWVSNTTKPAKPILVAGIVNKNPWIWQQHTSIETPINRITPFELPRNGIWVPPLIDLPDLKTEIIDPELEENKHEKQSARLIVIRRHKMRKHKLKKLRKKMKFEWAKKRQKREMKKEKLFQAELLSQIKEAEHFSAEDYVAEKLRKAVKRSDLR